MEVSPVRFLAPLFAFALVSAACAPAATATAPTSTAAAAPPGKIAGSTLGRILVDQKGMTLYTWVKDTDATSQCNDACAKTWPPLVSAAPTVTGEAVKGTLATSKRTD